MGPHIWMFGPDESTILGDWYFKCPLVMGTWGDTWWVVYLPKAAECNSSILVLEVSFLAHMCQELR